MSLMGVDIGTTGVKAAVFDGAGCLLAKAYEEYDLQSPSPGASELDSEAVVRAAFRVIGKAASCVKDGDAVAAVGIASQGEAFTAVSRDGRIMGNAMTSSDSRAEPFVGSWCEDFGLERLYRITGHTAHPMFSLFKLLWLRTHQPQVWRGAWKFLFFEDLLAFMLTGEAKTDYTMAARSMLFDLQSTGWSPEVLDRLGLSPDRLPCPMQSGTVVGHIKSDAAAEIGLKPKVPVAVCGHDQPVGALGCGAAVPGLASYSIGTVECICLAMGRPILDQQLMSSNLATYPHVLPDTYTTVAFNITGGSVLKWLRDNLTIEETAEARRIGVDPYELIISSASTKPAKVILVPHFGPTGTPHFDACGAGVLFGLKLSTERSEIIRAFLEGITYEMKWNLLILRDAGLDVSELRAIGGGAKSDLWLQIKADILGVPVTKMQVTEATCAGGAMLAGGAIGILDPEEASSSWSVPVKTFVPSRETQTIYDNRFSIYREIYSSLGAARRLLFEMKED